MNIIYCMKIFKKKHTECAANVYPMKTTGTGNYGVPAGKTYTIYVRITKKPLCMLWINL